jgi:hypothetical protein
MGRSMRETSSMWVSIYLSIYLSTYLSIYLFFFFLYESEYYVVAKHIDTYIVLSGYHDMKKPTCL